MISVVSPVEFVRCVCYCGFSLARAGHTTLRDSIPAFKFVEEEGCFEIKRAVFEFDLGLVSRLVEEEAVYSLGLSLSHSVLLT